MRDRHVTLRIVSFQLEVLPRDPTAIGESGDHALAAFVDAGNAFEGYTPEFDKLKVGVGAGVRYLTPVGPLRVDVAFPLQPDKDDSWAALYVGLGQSF